jgi:hypothetical protein
MELHHIDFVIAFDYPKIAISRIDPYQRHTARS